jgi:hypothetical protein
MTIQERWDGTFAKLDRSCPAQRADEAEVDYLRRLSRIGKKYIPRSEQMASVKFSELPDETVPKFSELMRRCVEKNLYRVDNMQPGELRPIMVVDEQTGAKVRQFIGPDSFVKAMGQPCRRVIGGLFQRDVGWLQQGVNDRALRMGIPQYDAKRNTFGNSRE